MTPEWTYTNTPGVAEYISLRGEIGRGEVARTVTLREGLLLDVDAAGTAIGVEIISPAAGLE